MKVRVNVYSSKVDFYGGLNPLRSYVMDHNSQDQRRVLGEQCRNAFEAGQVIVTHPE